MVKEQASTDAYLEMVKNNFLNAVSRKAELQNSFRPEMSRELNETVDTILKNAVELVKLQEMATILVSWLEIQPMIFQERNSRKEYQMRSMKPYLEKGSRK